PDPRAEFRDGTRARVGLSRFGLSPATTAGAFSPAPPRWRGRFLVPPAPRPARRRCRRPGRSDSRRRSLGRPPERRLSPNSPVPHLLSNVQATGRPELPAFWKPLVPARPLPLARSRAAPGSSGGARAALPGVCPWARPRHPTPEHEADALFDWVPSGLRPDLL